MTIFKMQYHKNLNLERLLLLQLLSWTDRYMENSLCKSKSFHNKFPNISAEIVFILLEIALKSPFRTFLRTLLEHFPCYSIYNFLRNVLRDHLYLIDNCHAKIQISRHFSNTKLQFWMVVAMGVYNMNNLRRLEVDKTTVISRKHMELEILTSE